MTTTDFATTLTEAIAGQPLTLERIAARLRAAGTPASVATLSYWKTGRKLPTRARSREVLAELDHILGLAPGTLTATLDACPTWSDDVIPSAPNARTLLAELGVDVGRQWTKVHTHDRLTVDERGHEVRQVSRQLLRAEVDGAHRWPIVLEQDSGLPGSVGLVRAISGMEIAAARHLPEAHLTVAAAAVPYPVPRGTMVAVEFEIEWGPQREPSHRMQLCLPGSSVTAILEVEFAQQPGWMRRYHCGTQPDAHTEYFDDLVQRPGWVQAVVTDAPAGIHGLTWDW